MRSWASEFYLSMSLLIVKYYTCCRAVSRGGSRSYFNGGRRACHVQCKEDKAKCVSLRSQKSPPNKAHAHLFNSLRSASHGPFIKLSVMAEWRFNMRHFYLFSLLFGLPALRISEFQTCNLAREYLPLFFLTEPSIARKRSIIREVLLNRNLREHAIGCLARRAFNKSFCFPNMQ